MNTKTIVQKLEILSKLAGVLLVVCACFRQHQASSYLSLMVVILYFLNSIFIEKDSIILKYLPITLAACFFLIGVFVCDNNEIWLGEIDMTTYYVGSFNLLALYYWIFFECLKWLDKFFMKFTRRNHLDIKIENVSITAFMYKYGGIIIFFMGTFLFISVIDKPIFIGQYFGRFDYAMENISRILNVLRVFPAIFCPVLVSQLINGEIKFSIKNFLKKFFIPYIPYILFLIWTGNKYGAFIEIVYLFVIPIMSVIELNKSSIKEIFKYTPAVFIGIIFLLILYYVLIGNTITESLNLIKLRVACQGELWWKSIATKTNTGFNINISLISEELNLIFKSIVEEAANKDYGIYHLMNIFGAPAVVEYYSARGTRFTAAGIELPFCAIGYVSFLVMPIIYGILISYFVNVYANATKEKRVFASIAAARLVQVTFSAIQQGDWYVYFSTVPFGFLCIMIFSQIASRRKISKRWGCNCRVIKKV